MVRTKTRVSGSQHRVVWIDFMCASKALAMVWAEWSTGCHLRRMWGCTRCRGIRDWIHWQLHSHFEAVDWGWNRVVWWDLLLAKLRCLELWPCSASAFSGLMQMVHTLLHQMICKCMWSSHSRTNVYGLRLYTLRIWFDSRSRVWHMKSTWDCNAGKMARTLWCWSHPLDLPITSHTMACGYQWAFPEVP